MGDRKKICVLVSGGLDSSVLACELARDYAQVHPVFIRSGLIWEPVELHWLRRFLEATHAPNLQPLVILQAPMDDVYGAHWSTTGEGFPEYEAGDEANYLPGRNIALLAKAAVYCVINQITAIALAPLQANPYPDGTPEFFQNIERVLNQGLESHLQIITSYRHLSKVEVIQRGRQWPLGLTFSCIAPVDNQHCGACNKCAERQKAFRKAGVEDPTFYIRHIRQKQLSFRR
ncbi:MAG: 7-cyano-7-deazaguanine synthase [Acidobacteria bacterium]|nr:7-cyano-7-deazaguanine synthase [Acidobacteriota bacterium]